MINYCIEIELLASRLESFHFHDNAVVFLYCSTLHVYSLCYHEVLSKPHIPPLNHFKTRSIWLKSSSHYDSFTLRLILSLHKGHVGQPLLLHDLVPGGAVTKVRAQDSTHAG